MAGISRENENHVSIIFGIKDSLVSVTIPWEYRAHWIFCKALRETRNTRCKFECHEMKWRKRVGEFSNDGEHYKNFNELRKQRQDVISKCEKIPKS